MSGCRFCGGEDLEAFLSLGPQPLADAFLREDQLASAEARYPLDAALCKGCSLVQILETVPPEELFCRDYPYYSSVSDALLDHSRRNVEGLIRSRGLGPSSLVVELASNDGYLLQYYVKRGISVLGIDPAEGPARVAADRGIETLNTFFTADLAETLRADGRTADVIHANNVLAHVADLNGFVTGIEKLLADGGVAVIEVPYVKDLIDHGEFDTIYHEHLCYFSVTALAGLFRRHGLTLNHLEHLTIHGGSLRLYAGRSGEVSEAVTNDLKLEAECGVDRPEYYRDFAARVLSARDELLGLLGELKSRGMRLAAYGAAAKGTVMLNFAGLGKETLDFVVDRNVHKQGLYMPGVRLPILAPEELMSRRPDYVLLLPWNFKDEILHQQAAFRASGGKFIIPVPRLEIV